MAKLGFRFSGNRKYKKLRGAAGDRYRLRPNAESTSTPLTFATLDPATPAQMRTAAAIAIVGEQMAGLTQPGYQQIAAVKDAANIGPWLGRRDDALHALYGIGPGQGRDEALHDKAHTVYELNYDAQAAEVMAGDWYRALACADDAATALAHRHLIGEARGWDQDAYDTLTRPWRSLFGPVHPDDSRETPASWHRHPIIVAEPVLADA